MVLIIYRRIRIRYQRVVRSRKSEERQHNNGQKKKDKRTNNDLQNTTQKTKIEQQKPALNPALKPIQFGNPIEY